MTATYFSRLAVMTLVLALGLQKSTPVQAQTQPASASTPLAAPASASALKRGPQQRFSSPELAVVALMEALQGQDEARVRAVLGQGAGRVIHSGDTHEDLLNRANWVSAYQRGHFLEASGERRAWLLLGQSSWPFPFPLVKEKSGWRFDTQVGLQNFLDRQVGENELTVLQVLDSYVQAQQEYVRRDRTKNGFLEYAQRMVSSEGQRDGLYWPSKEGEALSPMGARFALASLGRFRGTDEAPEPFQGYYFRPLEAQGRHAKGGAYDYIVNGHQIGGFALLATPARYGVSGVMTFMVNQDGVVFAKNLGADTARLAERITRFDPGPGWTREATLPTAAP